jgi:dipeptidyl aminopeptidase/acylaminoacyl peptidase
VQPDGSKRLLGRYDGAAWSPHGLFVAATRGHELVAVDPKGTVRWSLARGGRLAGARWSNDGFRIAYLAAGTLRVVAGDGTGDRLLARAAGSAAPAWLPGSTAHVLAYAGARGGIHVVDVDSGRVAWRSPPGPRPLELVWAGGRLIVRSARALRVLDAGEVVRTLPAPGGAEAVAVAPGGRELALARRAPRGQTEVVLVDLRGAAPPRRLFAGAGGFDGLAFSPDGRWLLLAWRAADEWLLVRPHGGGRVRAFSQIAAQFDPGRPPVRAQFPRLAGWCC